MSVLNLVWVASPAAGDASSRISGHRRRWTARL